MRRVSALEAAAAGLEVVAAAQTVAVERREEFGSGVAVEVREAEGVGCYVPAGGEGVLVRKEGGLGKEREKGKSVPRSKPEKVREGRVRVSRFGCEDCVDAGIGVVN
jgi:hypothetical protein